MILVPGARIDRYELIAPIGDGGMAQVWVAKHAGPHAFRRLFAIKVIHPRFADEPSFRGMFLDEARISSMIEHPNVAQVFDLGEENGVLFLAMEFVDGESVSTLQRAQGGGPMPVDVAVRVVADMCAGLHAAHSLADSSGSSQGIVHRDVSPQNVLASVKGHIKVIDFGIALARDRVANATGAGTLKGKLNYMAPEQAMSRPLGPAADIFGAGATLYRMLTGRAPFDGGGEAATLRMLLEGVRPAPLPPHIPSAINDVVDRALANQPGDRFATADEMRAALEAALADAGMRPDVGTWVSQNLSAKARERRAELSLASAVSTPRSLPAAAIAPAPEAAPVVEVPEPAPPPQRAAAAPFTPEELGPASRSTKTPGFLDVAALVKNARESAPDLEPPPPPAPRAGAAQPAPGRPDGPAGAAKPRVVPVQATAQRDERGPSSSQVTKVAVGLGAAVLLLIVTLLMIPFIVKSRLITDAKRAGITLEIEKVGVSFSGVTLRGVRARATRMPNVEVSSPQILSEGWSGKKVTIVGAQIDVSGAPTEVGVDAAALQTDVRKFLGAAPRRVVLTGGRVSWKGLLGEGSVLDASDVGIDGVWGADQGANVNVGRFEIKTPRATFGPWGASLERDGERSRVRLLFDPALVDGPNVLFVWTSGALTRVAVKVPRVALSRLGIPVAAVVGEGVLDGAEVEIALEGERTPAARVLGSGKASVYGARVKGVKGPVDVELKGNVSGQPGKPLDLYETSLSLGPFVVDVKGTLAPSDAGFRLDATWAAAPIPCDKLAKAEASSWGPFADALHDIARATGAVRVHGKAYASGIATFDTSAPWDAAVTVSTKSTCGVSLFGL
ncbi:MAG: serine/threonine-protein kinase [Polyangiaceae bacterium]